MFLYDQLILDANGVASAQSALARDFQVVWPAEAGADRKERGDDHTISKVNAANALAVGPWLPATSEMLIQIGAWPRPVGLDPKNPALKNDVPELPPACPPAVQGAEDEFSEPLEAPEVMATEKDIFGAALSAIACECHCGVTSSCFDFACDDNMDCTFDVCDHGRCIHFYDYGACESDGNPCTLDQCGVVSMPGILGYWGCKHTLDPNGFCPDDGNPCTDDLCSFGQCAHPIKPGPCDDGTACTLNDQCIDGVCAGTPKFCSDGNICTLDLCSGGICDFPPLDGGACATDNNPCTQDVCSGGSCAHLPIGGSCTSDGNVCTDDVCSGGACTHPPNNANCADDGNPCTNDVCSGGICTHPPQSGNCPDDGNPCTNDVCSGGICTHPAQSGNCPDDGNHCTDDVCSGGICTHPLNMACDDGDACTENICNPGGGCNYPQIDCDDGNDCTQDGCLQGACTHVATDGTFCNDGILCTVNDHCVGAGCVGMPRDCNDNNPCTADSCNTSTGICQHTGGSGPCDDGDPCTLNDVCAGSGCNGTPINCADSDPCTPDTCANGACVPGHPDCESMQDPCNPNPVSNSYPFCAQCIITLTVPGIIPINCDDDNTNNISDSVDVGPLV